MLVRRGLEVQIAVAKIGKYATESGDTVEMIERPNGGLSAVLVDGQRSGRGAKLVSIIVARKIVSLLAEGVRDGPAARAGHDYLRTLRQGKVSAELSMLSVDLQSGTVVISRNTQCPALVWRSDDPSAHLSLIDEPSQPIGVYERTKPAIAELPLEAGLHVILFSDGVVLAGARRGTPLDISAFVSDLLADGCATAPSVAEAILQRAIELDDDRPSDDISVVALAIIPDPDGGHIRRMNARFPV